MHTDSIQLYGASDTTITGNYIHDAAEGIMAPDGGDSGFLHIENNVFSRIDQQGVYLGFKPGLVLNHNTFSAGVMLHDDPTKGGSPTVGAVIKNNILLNGVAKQNLMGNAIAVEDYNLLAGGSGAHDIKAGKPTFAAGAAPTTFAGWLLAPGSVGAKAADDGADMGILPAPVAKAPAPAAPATKPAAMRRGGAPAISIKRPTAGSRFSNMLKVSATAKDNNGIDRVGFWLDSRWVGTDRAAPYKLRVKRPQGHALPLAHPDGARLLARRADQLAVGDAQARAPRRPLGPRGPERGLARVGQAVEARHRPARQRHPAPPRQGLSRALHRPQWARRQAPEAARRREGQAEQELRARATSASCACSPSRAALGLSPRRSAPAHRRGRVRAGDVALRLAGPVGVGLPHRAVDAVEHVGVVQPLDLVVDRARRRRSASRASSRGRGRSGATGAEAEPVRFL